MSSEEVRHAVDGKGKVMRMLHIYGDALWEMGDKVGGGSATVKCEGERDTSL